MYLLTFCCIIFPVLHLFISNLKATKPKKKKNSDMDSWSKKCLLTKPVSFKNAADGLEICAEAVVLNHITVSLVVELHLYKQKKWWKMMGSIVLWSVFRQETLLIHVIRVWLWSALSYENSVNTNTYKPFPKPDKNQKVLYKYSCLTLKGKTALKQIH